MKPERILELLISWTAIVPIMIALVCGYEVIVTVEETEPSK